MKYTQNNDIYEYTRTIRFKLLGENTNVLVPNIASSKDEKKRIFEDFITTYNNLLFAFKKAVFYEDKKNNVRVKSKLEIKKQWLRLYAREDFYKISESERKRSNRFQAKQFEKIFLNWFARNSNLLDEIQQVTNDNKRVSEIALLFLEIKNTDNFFFIKQFVELGIANDKDTDEYLEVLREIVDQFDSLISQVQLLIAPDMNQGVEISRASFNYYTVNKISKNFDKDIAEKENQLENSCYKDYSEKDKKLLDDVGFLRYIMDQKETCLENISIQNLYASLKTFKSEQKSLFQEEVQKKISADSLVKKFVLFQEKEKVEEYIKLTNEIEILANRKNSEEQNNPDIKELNGEIIAKKRKRGAYFQYFFTKYINYCNIFKNIAMQVGTRRAEIRALKQEAVESRLLKYWAFIVEKDNNKHILLIPKEKMQDVRILITDISKSNNSEYTLYSFNSLTLRALQKLIRRNLGKEQTCLNDDSVSLYQEVLRGKYPQLKLDYDGFEKEIKNIAETSYSSEEEFRLDFERVAYHISKQYISQKAIDTLQGQYGCLFLNISSYDLEKKVTNQKDHSQIWESFWDDENKKENFSVRINPEFRLYFRPKREQKDLAKQQNRFSKDHFGIAFTMTQNASQTRMVTSFAEEKELVKMVQKFNKDVITPYIKEKANNLYHYGIDRGQQELATLCVTKFSTNTEPIPARIKVYSIKDKYLNATKDIIIDRNGKKKTVILYKNPSYFIDDGENFAKMFEEKETACIDLSSAKLIKGKIILNGDMQTLLALKMINGKRQLFEKFSKIDPEAKVEFYEEDKNSKFQIKSKPNERNQYQFLPFYLPSHEIFLSREKMMDELQCYLTKLRTEEAESISIEKINHLRDAITSNMVGIISFLFEKYPGIIKLEDLVHSNIEKRFRENNEHIARRLEWSLYKKFQKVGLVPPRLRQTIFLHDSDSEIKLSLVKQFGIIQFVPTESTSANCPRCETSNSMKERKEEKYLYHSYICKKCNFDTNKPEAPFDFIKNSDDVAAYNIAKSLLND